jgi:acyl-[acyl-carrier-protein]-phospholipid O-acyltransferase/long-chain-fatty-acid--[acyl-carrier-protein] ligase
MALGWGALLSGRLDLMLGVLFLLATQATFFGPAKYGLLPEIVPAGELVRANGFVEMSTFVAIILGTALGSTLFAAWPDQLELIGLFLVALALAGLAVSLKVPHVPSSGARPALRLNPWGEISHGLRRLYSARVLWLTVLGITCFWLFAALLQMAILLFGKEVMGLDDLRVGLLGAFLALGVGTGSLIAGRLASHKLELGLVPLGAVGMGVGTLLLSGTASTYGLAAIVLVLLGLAGGCFIVPLQAFLQQQSPPQERGLLLATTNFLSMAAILVASGVLWALRDLLAFQADRIILLAGLVTLLGTGYALRLLPAVLLRLVCWMLTHSLYRIRVLGKAHIPLHGPALLVCNHVSYVDGLLVASCVPRLVRFLIYRPIYEARALHWLLRPMQAIPIAHGPESHTALAQARQALQQGHVVCIFAEGAISRTGNLLPFRRGFERIMEGLEVPVIPVHLDRLWGSIFSFQGGRFLWKWPKQWAYPVTVSFGAPLPATATACQVRQTIMELGSAAMGYRQRTTETLPRRFIATARRQWSAFCMADAMDVQLTYGQTLVRSLLLARWLRTRVPQAKLIGLLLPTSAMAAVLNLAVLLAGKVPVNLHVESDPAALPATLQQYGLTTVLTSRQLLPHLPLQGHPALLDVDAVMRQPTWLRQTGMGLLVRLLPTRLLQALCTPAEQHPDALATVVFSRGRTGKPRGVMLSHHNILANIEGLGQVFALRRRDRIMGVLSFHRAMGCTVTLWLPLIAGCGVVYQARATEARAVGEMVQRYQATLLVGTPALYALYLQDCPAPALASLRYAISGAEPLDPALALAFKAKYGVHLLEGYGCAEMASVISLNIGNVRYGKHHQTGWKPGSVGHPIPGVAVKVVDPATGQPLPCGAAGLLLVRGPHRMLGYLGQPQQTAQAMRQGWYITGDLATLDEDGFIWIVGHVPSSTPALVS